MFKYLLPILLLSIQSAAQDKLEYPAAHKDNTIDTYFGDTVADPYRWLEDDSLASTKKWVEEESDLSEKYLNKTDGRYLLLRQMTLNSWLDRGTLYKEGGYYFDFYLTQGYDMPPSMYIKKKLGGEGDKLIDPAYYKHSGRDKVRISGYSVSGDSKYIAFSLSYNGSDWQEIHVKELSSAFYRDEPDVIKWVKFSSIAWNDRGFYYSRYPEDKGNTLKDELKDRAIYYHILGSPQSNDQLIYKQPESSKHHFGFSITPSGEHLIIYGQDISGSLPQSNVLVLDLKKPFTGVFDTLVSTYGKETYSVIGEYKGKLLVKTDDAASTYRLMLYDMQGAHSATEIVPAYKQVLHDANIVGDKIVCVYTSDIDYSLITYDSLGKALNKIDFPEGTSIGGLSSDPKDSAVLFYSYSFIHPGVAYEYNVNTLTLELVEKTKIYYHPEDFDMKKVYVASKDGEQVPMIIAFKKGMTQNGDNPAILYGYGGYGVVNTPFYDNGFMTFLQNGGIVAVPCIRGGGELGEQWHMKGSMYNKQKSFDDFIAAADFLVNEKYTRRDKLAIMGGSNGGLLVAAVINQRPDICKVALPSNGVYDMLRYQKFTIGNAWKSEYGSSDDEQQYKYIKKYSPLHNIKDTVYPAILALTGDHDDRVVSLHAYKYVAAMQARNKGDNPILLMVRKNAGHQRSGVVTSAYVYSFIYEQMGISSTKLRWKSYY